MYAIRQEQQPFLIPVGILSEATFLIDKLLGSRHLEDFLASLTSGSFSLVCGENDLDRVYELVVRYRDLPLGYADAAVIACAERHGGRVLTLDVRHFGVVAREGKIEILP